MELNIPFSAIKKFKYMIIISMVIAFAVGFIVGNFIIETVYRSVAVVNVNRISINISKTFDENFYYLFYRYFRNSEDFSSDITIDLFRTEPVLKNSHEKLFDMGFDIAYDDFAKGIEVDLRDRNTGYRVVAVYPDPALAENSLRIVLEETRTAFDMSIKDRIYTEIEHRESKIDWLLEQSQDKSFEINNAEGLLDNSSDETEKVKLRNQLAGLKAERDVFNNQYEDNLIHIVRLKQVADFSFWELFEKETVHKKEAVEIGTDAVAVGLTSVTLALLIWLIAVYAVYIINKTRKNYE